MSGPRDGVGATSSSGFVGREREVSAISGHLRDAMVGRTALTVVEAEAGAGKTSVIREALARFRDASEAPPGLEVWAAAGDPNDPRALRCLAEALDCHRTSSDVTRARIGELLATSVDRSAEPVLAAVQELMVDLVERSAMSRPLVIVIDDLHWADDPTLATLGSLVGRLHGLPLAVLAATRPSGRVHRALFRHAPSIIGLGPFSDEELGLLAGATGNALDVNQLDALDRVRSNAFLVSVVVAAKDVDGGGAGLGSRDVVRVLAGTLEPSLRSFLAVAAVAGRGVDVDLLARVTDQRVATVVGLVREAVRRGWMDAGADGELRFRHDLLAEALIASVAPNARDHLHLGLGRTLAGLGHAPGRAAYHLDAASYLLGVEDVPHLLAVIDALASDDDLALALGQRARQLCPESPALAESVIRCLASRHRHADALEIAGTWLANDQGAGAPFDRIRLLAAASAVSVTGSTAAVALLRDGLAAGPTDALRADYLNALARLHFYERDAEAVEVAATEALDASRAIGSIPGEIAARCSLSEAASLLADLEQALVHADAALALAHAHSLPAAPAELALGTALVCAGEFREGMPALAASLREAESHGDPVAMALAQVVMQGSRFHAGEWDGFVADADAMVEMGAATGVRSGIVFPLGLAASVAVRRGDLVSAAALVARLRAEETAGDAHPASGVGARLGDLAELESSGRIAAAAAAAAALTELLAPTGFTAQSLVVMDAVRLAWEIDDRAALANLAAIVVAGAERSGSFTRRALAAFCAALLDGGADLVAAAAIELADTQRAWDGAVALHIAGVTAIERQGASAGRSLLRNAADRYRSLNSTRHAALAQSGMRFAGLYVDAGSSGPRSNGAEPANGLADLSAAERRVLELIAEGRANGDIGAALYVSKRTVESHVGSLYRKIGVSTRVALANAWTSRT